MFQYSHSFTTWFCAMNGNFSNVYDQHRSPTSDFIYFLRHLEDSTFCVIYPVMSYKSTGFCFNPTNLQQMYRICPTRVWGLMSGRVENVTPGFSRAGMFRIQEEPRILRNERELWKKQRKIATSIQHRSLRLYSIRRFTSSKMLFYHRLILWSGRLRESSGSTWSSRCPSSRPPEAIHMRIYSNSAIHKATGSLATGLSQNAASRNAPPLPRPASGSYSQPIWHFSVEFFGGSVELYQSNYGMAGNLEVGSFVNSAVKVRLQRAKANAKSSFLLNLCHCSMWTYNSIPYKPIWKRRRFPFRFRCNINTP